jgi:RimJ/RimL family protein N-acetyltransferase
VEGLLLRARPGVSAPAAPWPRAAALSTERLALEPLRPGHARELAPVLDDPALHAYTGGRPATEEELRARFTRQAAGHSPDGTEGWLNWVARDRATGEPVGLVQATIAEDADRARTAALAWVVATSRQGEGLATEAAHATMDWLRERGVARFAANIHPDHAASAAVARHLGLAPTDALSDGEVRWVGS